MQSEQFKRGYHFGVNGYLNCEKECAEFTQGWTCGRDAKESADRQSKFVIGSLTWNQVQAIQSKR